MKSLACTTIALIAACCNADATPLKNAYLDGDHNVHVVTVDGRDLKVTKKGKGTLPKLSADGETAAWRVRKAAMSKRSNEFDASELAIYRLGRIRTIKCERFIRNFWFWMDGKRIAIDCGGLHFAGREILYDTATLAELDGFNQADISFENRPPWSTSAEY